MPIRKAIVPPLTPGMTSAAPIHALPLRESRVRRKIQSFRFRSGQSAHTQKVSSRAAAPPYFGHVDWAHMSAKALGKGHIDFDRFFAFVRGMGYTGDFTCEATALNPDGSVRFDEMNTSLDRIRAGLTGEGTP